METQFYTRNAMTGWVLFAVFLSGILPGHSPEDFGIHQQELSLQDLPAIAAVIVVVFGAPFLGLVVGALVRLVLHIGFGHTYWGASRRLLAYSLYPQGHRPLWLPDRQRLDNLFAAYLFRYADPSLLGFVRRQHTARFLGYNWFAAALLGFLLWLVVEALMVHGGIPKLCCKMLLSMVVGTIVAGPTFFVGIRAGRDVERVEQMWARMLLREWDIDVVEAQENG